MEKTTKYELHLARRMSRLGTETAFEVLNKARALEAPGQATSSTLRSASPTSTRPRTLWKPA